MIKMLSFIPKGFQAIDHGETVAYRQHLFAATQQQAISTVNLPKPPQILLAMAPFQGTVILCLTHGDAVGFHL